MISALREVKNNIGRMQRDGVILHLITVWKSYSKFSADSVTAHQHFSRRGHTGHQKKKK
jgi:hypothetical protein